MYLGPHQCSCFPNRQTFHQFCGLLTFQTEAPIIGQAIPNCMGSKSSITPIFIMTAHTSILLSNFSEPLSQQLVLCPVHHQALTCMQSAVKDPPTMKQETSGGTFPDGKRLTTLLRREQNSCGKWNGIRIDQVLHP